MRLIRVVVLAVTLLGTGCGAEELFPEELASHPLSFGVVDSKSATEYDNSNLTEFGVFAYYTGQNDFPISPVSGTFEFMKEQIVTRNPSNGECTYSPIKYWSNAENDKFTFFAYAPTKIILDRSADFEAQRTLPPSIFFIVDGYPQYQIDLMLAEPQKNLIRSSSQVLFKMKHVMTRINFSARVVVEGDYQVVVEKIELINIYDQGRISLDPTDGWNVDYNGRPPTNFVLERLVDNQIWHSPELVDIVLTDHYQRINTPSGTLFMMPQPIENQRITVTYRLTDSTSSTTYSQTVPLKGISRWEMGASVEYMITYNRIRYMLL